MKESKCIYMLFLFLLSQMQLSFSFSIQMSNRPFGGIYGAMDGYAFVSTFSSYKGGWLLPIIVVIIITIIILGKTEKKTGGKIFVWTLSSHSELRGSG